MSQKYSRRDFLRGSAVGAAAIATVGLAGCAETGAAQPSEASYTYADTIAWDAEYDVVVVGFGGAGASTAIHAAQAGAKVLLCDKAPEGHEGGNSRYCAQITVYGDDAEGLLQYYKDLAWKFEYDEEVLRVYTQGMTEIPEMLKSIGAEDPVLWTEGTPFYDLAQELSIFPEYPELESGKASFGSTVNPAIFDSALWKTLRAKVMSMSDSISVWLESPGVHLIQDPETKTVIGVEIEKQGQATLVRALNGVVLTCGGFENNKEMVQDYIGAPRLAPLGTTYNTGDGVHMSLEVGADLWHMNCYESLGILAGHAWDVEDGQRAALEVQSDSGIPYTVASGVYGSGSIFLAGDDGSRYIREDAQTRHGHTYYCGVYRIPTANNNPFLVFDAAQLEELRAASLITPERESKIISAGSPEELAKAMGADPQILATTLENFNFYAKTGVDYSCGRDPESMREFSGDTYYAIALCPVILNTQGGPRRNSSAQVVTPQGEPIPNLYSAGECGGVCIFHYQAGGNMSECLIFGKIAGEAAAKEKDPLPALALPGKKDADIKYAIGEGDYAPSDDVQVELGENQYLGVSQAGIGGAIAVKVTYDGSKISEVEVVQESETEDIGGKALKELPATVVAANSADIDTITGATVTSKAFIEAVNNALEQA